MNFESYLPISNFQYYYSFYCDTNTGFIGCFVIELYSESALILEKIFEDENISMRYDSTNKEGWSFFENE